MTRFIPRNKKGKFTRGITKKFMFYSVVFGTLAVVSLLSLFGNTRIIDNLPKPILIAEAEEKDMAQQIGDQIAAFTRQLEKAERLQATYRIQEDEARSIINEVQTERERTKVLISDIRASIQGLTDSILVGNQE